MERCPIRDLEILEPSVEEVIRTIYEHGLERTDVA